MRELGQAQSGNSAQQRTQKTYDELCKHAGNNSATKNVVTGSLTSMLQLLKDLPHHTDSHKTLILRIIDSTVPAKQFSNSNHQTLVALMAKLRDLGAQEKIVQHFTNMFPWACVALQMQHIATSAATTDIPASHTVSTGIEWIRSVSCQILEEVIFPMAVEIPDDEVEQNRPVQQRRTVEEQQGRPRAVAPSSGMDDITIEPDDNSRSAMHDEEMGSDELSDEGSSEEDISSADSSDDSEVVDPVKRASSISIKDWRDLNRYMIKSGIWSSQALSKAFKSNVKLQKTRKRFKVCHLGHPLTLSIAADIDRKKTPSMRRPVHWWFIAQRIEKGRNQEHNAPELSFDASSAAR